MTTNYVTNDPFTLQSEVRTAYLLHREGLLTDKEFADVVGAAVRKTTNVSVLGDPSDKS